MTKTEYRKYTASQVWQTRRHDFLQLHDCCERCELPRDLAVVAYDQDLHVHHRSYANLGDEADEDLESLCKRCHEIETFGRSSLHAIKTADCRFCGQLTFNVATHWCEDCRVLLRDHISTRSLFVTTKWGIAGENFIKALSSRFARIMNDSDELERVQKIID